MKKSIVYYAIFLIVIIISLYIAFVVVINKYISLKNEDRILLIIMGFLFMLSNILLLFVGYFFIKKKRENINKSFNYYVEKLIAEVGVGMICFNENGEIIWISNFINFRLGVDLIGKKIINISETFKFYFLKKQKLFNLELEGITYQCKIDFFNKAIILKDTNFESIIIKKYVSKKLVLGELEIDNFQQLQTILPEEELFKAKAKVIKMLDFLIDKYNIIYRQYVNGKYIIITDQKTLDTFITKKFNFLNQIRKHYINNTIQLTISIGFGANSWFQKKLIGMAKSGLLQAQSRGGDQVAVNFYNIKTQYFGSKSEIAHSKSKIKIRQIAQLIEKRMSSDKIKKVIIYGHKDADLDAIGASLGMYELAKAYNKDVYIQNVTFDLTTEQTIEQLLSKEQQQIFIKPNYAKKISKKENTIIIIVDTAEIDRIENSNAFEKIDPKNIFILDHHRVSKLPKNIDSTNIYIDTTASSASEIVVEILTFSKAAFKIRQEFAQMLLNGIYLDTKQFQTSCSYRTFQAAAFLKKHGALITSSVDSLKLSENDSRLVNLILSKIKEIKPGYFLSTYPNEIPSNIVSAAANEILRTKDRKAAFVIAKVPGKKEFKLSARGINTNVQLIAEAVGGGGHFSTAAAVSNEELNIFEDNVIQAIASKKGDE